MAELPEQIEKIIRAIKNDNLILWVGSGYSTSLGFPDWKEFIKKLSDEYFKNHSTLNEKELFLSELNSDNPDYFNLLNKLSDKPEILGILQDEFRLPFENDYSPLAIPFKKLWRLSDKIITTNYDRALNVTKDNNCRTVLWNRPGDYEVFQNNQRKYLFKLHGSIKYPESCIVFPEQYDNLYNDVLPKSGKLPTLPVHYLRTILSTHTVLFLGYGIKGDKQIDTIFQYLNDILKEVSEKKHFIFLKEGSDLNRDFLSPIYIKDFTEISVWIDYLLKTRENELPVSENFEPFSDKYFGRDDEYKILVDFFENENEHFKFIWGRGGMGKSHLLHNISKQRNIRFNYFKLKETTTFQELSNKLKLGILIDESNDLYSQPFIDALEKVKNPIIFDDFYEIDTPNIPNVKLKNTLIRLKDINSNKIILISRAYQDDFRYHSLKIDLLPLPQFNAFIKNEALYYSYKISEIEVDKIWNIARGYPLVGRILLDIISKKEFYPDFDIDKWEKFNFEEYDSIESEGKEYVERLLNVLLNGKDKESKDFLFNFSIGKKEIPLDLLKSIPNYKSYKAVHSRKGFIKSKIRDDISYFSLHPLIRELLRIKAGERPEAELIFGKYYLGHFENNYDDIESYNLAEYHFNKTDVENKLVFSNKIRKLLNETNIKNILSPNIESSIARLEIRKISSNREDTYHQIASLYVLLGKPNKAINEIENGLIINPKSEHLFALKCEIYFNNNDLEVALKATEDFLYHINPISEYILLLNARVYRKLKLYKESSETLMALIYNYENHIHARNEIGILYREWAKTKQGKEEKEDKYLKAEKWLEALANENHIHARNEIGILYREWAQTKQGKEKEDKYLKAEKWLEALAKENHIHARNEIGILYREWAKTKQGKEKEDKYLKAEKWLETLAQTNYRIANELALLYRDWGTNNYKIGNERRIKQAIETYKIAINLKKDNIQSYDGICKSLQLFDDVKNINESIGYAIEGLKINSKDRGLNLFLARVFTYRYQVKSEDKAFEYINRLPDSGWYGDKKAKLNQVWKK